MATLEEIREWLKKGGEEKLHIEEEDELDDGYDEVAEVELGSLTMQHDLIKNEYVFKNGGNKIFTLTQILRTSYLDNDRKVIKTFELERAHDNVMFKAVLSYCNPSLLF